MLNWYSQYLLGRARQLEIACEAELHRRLAESKGLKDRRGAGRPARPFAYRLGAVLILIGRSLQGPFASGR